MDAKPQSSIEERESSLKAVHPREESGSDRASINRPIPQPIRRSNVGKDGKGARRATTVEVEGEGIEEGGKRGAKGGLR